MGATASHVVHKWSFWKSMNKIFLKNDAFNFQFGGHPSFFISLFFLRLSPDVCKTIFFRVIAFFRHCILLPQFVNTKIKDSAREKKHWALQNYIACHFLTVVYYYKIYRKKKRTLKSKKLCGKTHNIWRKKNTECCKLTEYFTCWVFQINFLEKKTHAKYCILFGPKNQKGGGSKLERVRSVLKGGSEKIIKQIYKCNKNVFY